MVLIFVISSVFEVLAGIINESFYCFWKCDKDSLYDGSDFSGTDEECLYQRVAVEFSLQPHPYDT
jgi:hypothetical protein